MANKKTKIIYQTSGGKQIFLRALSYCGLVISALMVLVGGILNLIGLNEVTALLNKIASIFLLIAVAWPAWDFCSSKAKWMKILYAIALLLYILGMVFGFLSL